MKSDFISSRFIHLLEKSRTMSSIYEVMMGDHLDSFASQWLNEAGEVISVSFRTLNENVKSMAAFLSKKLGSSRQGCFAGLSMENSHLWQVCFWALLMAGFKPVLIDINHKEEMVDYIIKSSGAVAILGNDTLNLKSQITKISLDELNSVNEKPEFTPQWADSLALCTSGTTATAKVLVFDGAAIASQLEGFYRTYIKNPRIASAPTPLKCLAFLPMHHVLGFITSCIAYPFLNKTIVFLKDRTPTSIQAACQQIGVTHMVSVPLLINNLKNGVLRKIRNEEPKKEKMLNMLLKISLFIQKIAPKTGDFFVRKHITKSIIKKLFGDTFAWICVGGTHVPSDSLRFINGLGHIATIGYGMTECGIIAFEPGTTFKKRIDGTTGPLMHGFRSKIVDIDGKDAGTGELLLKGTSMHSGRMQNGKMISADVDENGWLHTGDIARFVNGSLVIEGRLKEVILNESGENIYPDELEDYFEDLSNLVKRYCILGINNKGNDKIAIVVEPQDSADNEKGYEEISRIVDAVNGQLPFLKRIKLIFAAKEPMPLANGMKVRRQKLKEMIEDNVFPVIEIQMNISPLQASSMTVIKKAPDESIKTKGRAESESDDRFINIKEQVIQCFAEVLDTTPDKIGDDMRFVEDLGGDSLDSLELLAMAEARFGMMIEESDYLKCRTVDDVICLVYEKVTGLLPGESHGGAQVHAGKASTSHTKNVIPITKFTDTPEYKSFETRLDLLKKSKNPYYIPHDSALRDISVVMGKEVINFGSYNYLGLSGNPQVSKAAIDAINKMGTSASGSRLLAGEKSLHRELEKEIADWKHTEAALALVGGHSTNVTFVGNFCNDKDLILYDVLSHNSIAQGIKLSHATSRLFPHNDYKAARAILTALRDKFEKVLLIIEGVYSMDGDIAPVPEFIKLKKEFGLFLMVDEAHSSCVIGKNGGGVDGYFNLKHDDIDIKMGTLSKGLGSCGGYLAGKKELIEYLRYSLPGFIFSVGLSPALAASALESLRIIRKDNSLVRQLQENIRYFVSKAKEKGFNLCKAGESAIAPVLVGKDSDAFDLSRAMFEKGIFVPPAVYPAVPANMSRMRFCLTSCHNEKQIGFALDTLQELAVKMNINLRV